MNALQNDAQYLYPVRKKHLKIQSFTNYKKILDFHSGAEEIVPADTALILELCSGKYDVNTITDIIEQTFSLNRANAVIYVNEILKKYSSAITFLPTISDKGIPSNPIRILKPEKKKCHSAVYRDENPSMLIISITYKCNHRCCYCCNSSGESTAGELPATEWAHVIDEAAEIGIKGIHFSGGEPLLVPGIFTLLKRIVDRKMYPTISTNGALLTESTISKLAETGTDFIHLSLSAANDELYDRITGRKGNLPIVKNAIKDLKKHGFFIRAKVILMSLNISEVEAILDFCADYGVDFIHFETFKLTHISRSGKELLPSLKDLEKVNELVEKKRKYLDGKTEISCPPPAGLKWKSVSDIVKCGGIKSSMTILPNGDITFCEAIAGHVPQFIMGNVGKNTLMDIWYSDKPEKILEQREEFIEEPCRSCEHLAGCRTGCYMCSLIHSDNPWSVDPRCWKATISNNAFDA